MKNEDPYRVKAAMDKQRLSRVSKENENIEEESEENELPTRSSVRKGKKRKIKTPIISSLAILFILLPVLVLVINSVLQSNGLPSILPSETSGVFEKVNITYQNAGDGRTKESDEEESTQASMESTKQKNEEVKLDDPKDESGDTKEVIIEEDKKNKEEKSNAESQSVTKPAELDSSEGNIIYHQVQTGETLFTIALKYYPAGNGMEIIKVNNNLTTNTIQAGQTLKIILQ